MQLQDLTCRTVKSPPLAQHSSAGERYTGLFSVVVSDIPGTGSSELARTQLRTLCLLDKSLHTNPMQRNVFIYLLVCVCGRACVQVKRQLVEDSLLPLCGPWGTELWPPLPTEPPLLIQHSGLEAGRLGPGHSLFGPHPGALG